MGPFLYYSSHSFPFVSRDTSVQQQVNKVSYTAHPDGLIWEYYSVKPYRPPPSQCQNCWLLATLPSTANPLPAAHFVLNLAMSVPHALQHHAPKLQLNLNPQHLPQHPSLNTPIKLVTLGDLKILPYLPTKPSLHLPHILKPLLYLLPKRPVLPRFLLLTPFMRPSRILDDQGVPHSGSRQGPSIPFTLHLINPSFFLYPPGFCIDPSHLPPTPLPTSRS
ncbi:hypothetical protein GWK47_000843 [Chionoecetes opilio]|uniref:Uncharacterized protein n=1 Tax=Chionoecetes opilio TaxID=41210 RepID=A0A8J5CQZ5_CHIOP|nr:hypothetical protein GWK47_000843 [Chionoecetes opilio]